MKAPELTYREWAVVGLAFAAVYAKGAGLPTPTVRAAVRDAIDALTGDMISPLEARALLDKLLQASADGMAELERQQYRKRQRDLFEAEGTAGPPGT